MCLEEMWGVNEGERMRHEQWIKCTVILVQFIDRYVDCRRMYRNQDLPSEVETGEIEVADGSECGPVEDVTVAVEGRRGGREGGRMVQMHM